MVAGFGKRMGSMATAFATSLALANSLALSVPAVAQELPTGEYGMKDYDRGYEATGTGETKLYLMKDQYANVGNEGAGVDKQLQVTIPVGIHYTVMGNNSIVGPADEKVFFRNMMTTSDVHVSGIAVQEANGASIVKRSAMSAGIDNFPHDALCLGMRPDSGHFEKTSFVRDNTGHNDEFGSYVGNAALSPVYKNDWNIVSGGALALDGLGGDAPDGVVFDELSPAAETQIGSVRWTVRLGTRAEADAHDASVTLRFHANGGTPVSGQPLADVTIPVLNAEALPEVEVLEGALDTELPNASGQLVLRNVDLYGVVRDYEFEGWVLDPDEIDLVENIGDLVELADVDSVEELAGKTITLYASYL